jgi:hypothetical protein
VVTVLVVPPALVLLVWGIGKLRRIRAATAEDRQRLQTAQDVHRRLRTPVTASAASVRRLLTDFLRARLKMPPGEITPDDAAERLEQAGVNPLLARQFADLLDTCTTAEFAPGLVPIPPSDLAARADRLLRIIQQQGVMI